MKFVILGGYGGMGRVCAFDLFASNKQAQIVIAGRDLEKAQEFAQSFRSKRVRGAAIDVTNVRQTARLLQGCSVVINCVQYYYNLYVMKAALQAKCNYVDLGGLFHFTKKQIKLDKQFKNIQKVAVLGCGSTPGITNVMTAYGAQFFDRLEEIYISFADKDYTKYKLPFVTPYSPATLIDEFTLPPAIYHKGRLQFVQPMSGLITLHFPSPIGNMKGFYSLHSELASLPLTYKKQGLKECSFRVTFPHTMIMKMKHLLQTRTREDVIRVLTQWIPDPNIKIKDLEYLKITLKGKKNNKNKIINIFCLTKVNKKHNIPAGSYDTGVPPSIVAQMISKRQIPQTGVIFPEDMNYKIFLKELKKRRIEVLMAKNYF